MSQQPPMPPSPDEPTQPVSQPFSPQPSGPVPPPPSGPLPYPSQPLPQPSGAQPYPSQPLPPPPSGPLPPPGYYPPMPPGAPMPRLLCHHVSRASGAAASRCQSGPLLFWGWFCAAWAMALAKAQLDPRLPPATRPLLRCKRQLRPLRSHVKRPPRPQRQSRPRRQRQPFPILAMAPIRLERILSQVPIARALVLLGATMNGSKDLAERSETSLPITPLMRLPL